MMNFKLKICGVFRFNRQIFAGLILGLLAAGCSSRQSTAVKPVIELTKIPPASEGGTKNLAAIAGRVTGDFSQKKIVLYAHSGIWWVQPQSNRMMTNIEPDGNWENQTHLGIEYAALLVEPDYIPPAQIDELPAVGGLIRALTIVPGGPSEERGNAPQTLQFSGYEWNIRTISSDRGGAVSEFDPANARVDEKGLLHLKISRRGDDWTCAEVSLTRSLGYGTYRFVTKDISQLEPAAVLSFDTWDALEAGQNHREVDVEITRWGDPVNKNLQYVVQPYNVPANVARFAAPAGALMHSFDWQPGRIEFKTVRGREDNPPAPLVAEHSFMSGVPAPGGERVLINFYVLHYAKIPLEKEAEAVIEKFEFLP